MYKIKDLKDFCNTLNNVITENERMKSEIEDLNNKLKCYEDIFDKITQLHSKNNPIERKEEKISCFKKDDEKEYVDLGLPSGLLWAKCNIDAKSETDFGSFFGWGMTKPYVEKEDNVTSEHYNNLDASHINSNLKGSNDAATVNWGQKWRMPTKEEFEELYDDKYTDSEWSTINGVNGWKIMNKKDHSKYIFLPAAGDLYGLSHDYVGRSGYYWSSSFGNSTHCWTLHFLSGNIYMDYYHRGNGFSVRPVRA